MFEKWLVQIFLKFQRTEVGIKDRPESCFHQKLKQYSCLPLQKLRTSPSEIKDRNFFANFCASFKKAQKHLCFPPKHLVLFSEEHWNWGKGAKLWFFVAILGRQGVSKTLFLHYTLTKIFTLLDLQLSVPECYWELVIND